jgi:splicing factor 3B subunit 2
MRPEVVEWEDVTAKDPVLLVQLKSVRNGVPVPGHWSRKRKYLAGKRGFVKPPFELPQFIKDTGIMELRQAALDEDATKRQKTKAREKMHPRLGRITVDYEKLHNAFFRYQTKPLLTGHGDLYYEGKEFEGRSRDVRPGFLSEELRTALGMGHLMPPPWIHNIQKYGAPPSYPHMRIPGFNAPIPEGAQWGFHPGGWGKPPVDTFVSPSAVTGHPDAAQMRLLLTSVEANIWGELEPDAEEESYFIDQDQQQRMTHQVQEMTLDEDQAESFAYEQLGKERDSYTPAAFDTAGPETVDTRRRR